MVLTLWCSGSFHLTTSQQTFLPHCPCVSTLKYQSLNDYTESWKEFLDKRCVYVCSPKGVFKILVRERVYRGEKSMRESFQEAGGIKDAGETLSVEWHRMAGSQDNHKTHAGSDVFRSLSAPASPAHFAWKYNTEISLNPLSVPLKNWRTTGFILNISLVCLHPLSHPFNAIQSHKNLIQTIGFTWTTHSALGCLQSWENVLTSTTNDMCVFITMELLRLIARMMSNIWPYELGWVVYVTL